MEARDLISGCVIIHSLAPHQAFIGNMVSVIEKLLRDIIPRPNQSEQKLTEIADKTNRLSYWGVFFCKIKSNACI